MILFNILLFVYVVSASRPRAHNNPAADTFKDQFCTDPRTMRKHAAYSEWADAYSCTRHRCQPGGRNLAIYTVGCKRVEAPESAIECEEVVEDTNMQFPFCCTRLRCLVVVRGEVWTRVLGQPWETLPAAPWSHMYKMKKPPPVDGGFLPKTGDGPIYELSSDSDNADARQKVSLRSTKEQTTKAPDCNHKEQRSVPTPDIVIALSTDVKERKKDTSRHGLKRGRKTTPNNPYLEDAVDHNEIEALEIEEPTAPTDKPSEMGSDERSFANSYGVTKKPLFKAQPNQISWTEIPPSQWNEHSVDVDKRDTVVNIHPDTSQIIQEQEKKEEKPSNLQALVDAIGTRMRDIENVVQKMSEKVHQKPGEPEQGSIEKRTMTDNEASNKHPLSESKEHGAEKKSNNDNQLRSISNSRFTMRAPSSQYLNGVTTDTTTEQPIEDNGYFSDASNTIDRRSNIVHPPKEPPAETYMAPVDTRRKTQIDMQTASDEVEKKRKKRVHKKKKAKGHSHKKRRSKEDKRKHIKLSSVESEKIVGSLEDNSAMGDDSTNKKKESSPSPIYGLAKQPSEGVPT